jgi:hypothetical protein
MDGNSTGDPWKLSRERLRVLVAFLAVLGGILALVLLSGCGGHKADAGKASALATSTVAQQAKTDAQQVLAGCFPVVNGKIQVPTSKADLTRDITCEGVPKGSRLKAVACVVSAVANGGASGAAPEEDAVLNATAACVEKYRAGATPSASAT